jgi:hypothetical protein
MQNDTPNSKQPAKYAAAARTLPRGELFTVFMDITKAFDMLKAQSS